HRVDLEVAVALAVEAGLAEAALDPRPVAVGEYDPRVEDQREGVRGQDVGARAGILFDGLIGGGGIFGRFVLGRGGRRARKQRRRRGGAPMQAELRRHALTVLPLSLIAGPFAPVVPPRPRSGSSTARSSRPLRS